MGTIKKAISALLGLDQRLTAYNQTINANSVLFSSFGRDICASDIVKTAIHRVCSEVKKCSLKSVIEKDNPRSVRACNDSINDIFAGRVNPFCNLNDFLYKVAYITLVNKNCFIYWAYDEVPIANTNFVYRKTRGFYPIERATVKLYVSDGELRAELTSDATSEVFDLPYSDLIHVRYDYGASPYFGGDVNGLPDNRAILANLQTLHVIKEAIPKSLQASLSLKGVLTMNSIADVDKKEITREEFEKHLFKSESGIVATDYEASFSPVNISSTDIPTNIFNFIRDELLSPFGVSVPIYTGKYTDEEYTAFYQTAVEGILIAIANAMKITLFTPAQINAGHTIKYYDKLVQSLSYTRRQAIAEMTKDDALLSRDERRELLGYEPDGEPTRVSLNYIDASIANAYQLQELNNKTKKEVKNA